MGVHIGPQWHATVPIKISNYALQQIHHKIDNQLIS